MRLRVRVWRQAGPDEAGRLVEMDVDGLHPDMSLLELLDQLNDQLVAAGERVVEFDHDCREGICGQCGLMVNGRPHGPQAQTTTCQVHLRSFSDGDTLTLEPFRAAAFPVLCDLRVDRSALDRVLQAGAWVSTPIGGAPEANSVPVPHDVAEAALDAAACIGCGACVAACGNASAALFVGAKITHLALLPQGQPEARSRARAMTEQMDAEGFGHCSLTGACAVECPQGISLGVVARMNWEVLKARVLGG
jgi:succinate dehydrogenase / fumarate reductase iron-sulfur subunit